MTGTIATRGDIARRAGVEPAFIDRLCELGLIDDPPDGFGESHVRRVRVVHGLDGAGLPLPALAEAIRRGDLALDFVDEPAYERFAGFSGVSFRQLSEQAGVPLELMLTVREATGFAVGSPTRRRNTRRRSASSTSLATRGSRRSAGDEAAADLAGRLARLVERASGRRGGKPVKWLGDGVMFHFREPGPATVAALEMVEGAAREDLPPAHVGIHAGPVLFQEGDYFGRTVNVAARIADYARQGEVLVSQASWMPRPGLPASASNRSARSS